jgi:hypothetical protein
LSGSPEKETLLLFGRTHGLLAQDR